MRRDLWIGCLLAALTLGLYWPVGNHDFIFFDDPQFITKNPQIQAGLTWSTVRYAFTSPVVGNWHPVTILSHALDCELFGVKPGGHHLVNALLHALNAGLLFILLRRLTSRPASLSGPNQEPRRPANPDTTWPCALVAGIFALHPLRVESVAWVAERKDLLSGLFFLLTIGMYAGYVHKSGKRESGKAETRKGRNQTISSGHGAGARSFTGLKWYLGSLACFALGLMSKPMVVTLPFVLLLLDIWPLERIPLSNPKSRISKLRGIILEKLPFFILSLADCWITLHVQRNAGAMQDVHAGWLARGSNAIESYVRYLGKLFWPTNLAVVYPHPAKLYFLTDAWPGWEILAAAMFLVLVTVLTLLRIRRQPYLAVGWLWYLGMLVPVIGLVQVGEQAMADRYTYLPLIGPVMALVWWLSQGLRSPAMGQALRRLYPQTALTAPDEHSRATALPTGKSGSPRSSRTPTPSGRPSRPGWGQLAGVLILLGLLGILTRHQLGYWQNTATLFEHAVAVTADNPSAQFSFGVGLEDQGQLGPAMVRYRMAVAIDPHYAKAYYNMGQLLRKRGDWQPAAQAYLSAARWNPTDVPTQLNLASVLARLGRGRDAIDHFNKALQLDPNSVEGLNNLAWLLSTTPDASIRDGARAVELAQRACSLSGFKMPVFLGTLAAAYAEAGRFTEAVTTAQSAASLAAAAGDSTTAAKNQELARLYAANKPYRDAP